MGKDYLLDLMRSKNTIFTTKDVSLLWQEPDVNFVRKKLYRYIKAGKLYSVRKGVYAKDKNVFVYYKPNIQRLGFVPPYDRVGTYMEQSSVPGWSRIEMVGYYNDTLKEFVQRKDVYFILTNSITDKKA